MSLKIHIKRRSIDRTSLKIDRIPLNYSKFDGAFPPSSRNFNEIITALAFESDKTNDFCSQLFGMTSFFTVIRHSPTLNSYQSKLLKNRQKRKKKTQKNHTCSKRNGKQRELTCDFDYMCYRRFMYESGLCK